MCAAILLYQKPAAQKRLREGSLRLSEAGNLLKASIGPRGGVL